MPTPIAHGRSYLQGHPNQKNGRSPASQLWGVTHMNDELGEVSEHRTIDVPGIGEVNVPKDGRIEVPGIGTFQAAEDGLVHVADLKEIFGFPNIVALKREWDTYSPAEQLQIRVDITVGALSGRALTRKIFRAYARQIFYSARTGLRLVV